MLMDLTEGKPEIRFMPSIKEKRWDHRTENLIYDRWLKEHAYDFKFKKGKRPFVIDTPPPYPSGTWHIGAVAQYSQIDMIARSRRMAGESVLFPVGIDRNGIPVEIYTENLYKVKMRDIPREKFIELCNNALDDLEDKMLQTMKRIGLSCDFQSKYRTDREDYRRITQSTFIKLWSEGLVYEATRPNNYCHDCGTTIADAEVEYKELQTRIVYIRFKVKDAPDIVIATTRPELICSCQLIIVNPTDQRYTSYHGKHAILPIYGREVEIKPNPNARPEFGTGVVMICSYGDYNDVLLFRELGLKEIVATDQEGRLTEAAGEYRGMTTSKARSVIINDLEQQALIVKVENIVHRTPVCSRSSTPIEIIPMKEYYLKQIEFIPKLKKLAHAMRFHPPASRQILLDWLDSIAIDWPISRRRVYATEIPVWYCKSCGAAYVPPPGKYYRPWKDAPPIEQCAKCKHLAFEGETRTFDTWMDSSVSALYVTKFERDERFFKHSYPAVIRPQGKDIVRTWLHYSILRCYQLTGQANFKTAWVAGLGMDEQGQAMHKSKGNVIDPVPILERYGADAFRFWSASEATHVSDFRCSEIRIQGAHKFLTKLWNLSRFISSFPQVNVPQTALMASDEWILAELSGLIDRSLEGYGQFNFFVPANEIRDFVWETFASHYLEMVKPRAYGQGFSEKQQKAAWFTLHKVLRNILLLLAPLTPFMTDQIWRTLYSDNSVHLHPAPKRTGRKARRKVTSEIIAFNKEVWKIKEEKKLGLRDTVNVGIPKGLRRFREDLIRMHSLITDH
jgi:valyl-tRNA synthetase